MVVVVVGLLVFLSAGSGEGLILNSQIPLLPLIVITVVGATAFVSSELKTFQKTREIHAPLWFFVGSLVLTTLFLTAAAQSNREVIKVSIERGNHVIEKLAEIHQKDGKYPVSFEELSKRAGPLAPPLLRNSQFVYKLEKDTEYSLYFASADRKYVCFWKFSEKTWDCVD